MKLGIDIILWYKDLITFTRSSDLWNGVQNHSKSFLKDWPTDHLYHNQIITSSLEVRLEAVILCWFSTHLKILCNCWKTWLDSIFHFTRIIAHRFGFLTNNVLIKTNGNIGQFARKNDNIASVNWMRCFGLYRVLNCQF